MNKMGIYIVQFDRAGYGESDPNPKRSLRSEASDIEELADQLELGPKFYIIAISAGCYSGWSCLKHIPQRYSKDQLFSDFCQRSTNIVIGNSNTSSKQVIFCLLSVWNDGSCFLRNKNFMTNLFFNVWLVMIFLT